MQVRVSKVHVSGDESFWSDRIVYRLRPSGGWRYIADDVILDIEDKFCAICCSYRTEGDEGAEMFLVRERNQEGIGDCFAQALKDAVSDEFSIERFVGWPDISRVPEYVRINLLLDYAYREHDRKGAACAGKVMFVYSFGANSEKKKRQIKCLEVFVDSRNNLNLSVRTFSKVDGFEDGFVACVSGRRKHVGDYPSYKLSADGCLVPSRYGAPDDDEFIPHHYPGKFFKSKMDFMVLSFSNGSESPLTGAEKAVKISKTKMGVLADVLKRIERVYDGKIVLEFERLLQMGERRADKRALAELDVAVPRVRLDIDKGMMSVMMAVPVLRSTLDSLGVGIVEDEDAPCLHLIGNADDYASGDKEDPYDDLAPSLSFQRICSATASSKTAVMGALREIAFKKDVLSGRVGIIDWKSLGIGYFSMMAPYRRCSCPEEGSYGEAVKSGRALTLTGISRLVIEADGSMHYSFSSFEECLLDPIYDDACTGFLRDIASERAVAIVQIDGSVFYVMDTGMFPIPNDLEGLDEALREPGVTSYRAEAKKDLYYRNVLDLRFVEDAERNDGSVLYFLGTPGKSLQYIRHAAPIRRIVPLKGSIPINRYASLLTVDGVRIGAATVLPFPAKYLRAFEDEEIKARYRP